MSGKLGKLHMNTSFRNGCRKAGIGVVYDDYSEESGNPSYFHNEPVRFPHDGIDPETLSGPVICYKGEPQKGKRKTENVDRCICCGEIIPEGSWVCPICLVSVKGEDDGKA